MMGFHFDQSILDKIDDCSLAAEDTARLCREFRGYVNTIKLRLQDAERALRCLDIDGDPLHPACVAHKIIEDTLTEIEECQGR